MMNDTCTFALHPPHLSSIKMSYNLFCCNFCLLSQFLSIKKKFRGSQFQGIVGRKLWWEGKKSGLNSQKKLISRINMNFPGKILTYPIFWVTFTLPPSFFSIKMLQDCFVPNFAHFLSFYLFLSRTKKNNAEKMIWWRGIKIF